MYEGPAVALKPHDPALSLLTSGGMTSQAKQLKFWGKRLLMNYLIIINTYLIIM